MKIKEVSLGVCAEDPKASGLGRPPIGLAGILRMYVARQCFGALLHGDETAALGDAGYQGVEKREENRGKSVIWHVAMKRSKRKSLPKNRLGRQLENLEHLNASGVSLNGRARFPASGLGRCNQRSATKRGRSGTAWAFIRQPAP